MAAGERPDPDNYLLFDANDGLYLYDANDEYFLRDGNAEIVLPPIPGSLDPVGGPIGGSTGERVILIDTPDAGTSSAPAEWLAIANHPIMGRMYGALPAVAAALALRVADRDFVTLYDDPTSPSQYWDGRVLDPGSIALTIPMVPVGAGAIETRFGSVVLANTDGVFDTILDFTQIVSQAIRIRIGTVQGHLEDFETICVARVTDVAMTQEALTLGIRDPATYAQNLYPTSIYSGTGGVNGSADLEGTIKPVVLGRVWNMAPTLIDPVKLIYQAHDGAMAAVSGVFDGGVALTAGANYATYALLTAATVGAGTYATCRAEGLIRLGSTPVFAVTAHIDGQSEAGTTVRAIATYLAAKLETEVDLDIDNAAFALLPSAVAGWVWTEPFTLAEAITRFVGDAGYHWGSDVDGAVTTRRLTSPAATATKVFEEPDILDIERVSLPDGYGNPHHRRVIQYKRNWTVQSGALAATAVESSYRQREWRTAVEERSTGARNAIDPPVLQTSLALAADAANLANQLLDLHGIPRRMFRMTVKIHGSLPVLGSTVLVAHPRFGLISGDFFRVLDIALEFSAGNATLLLWG